MYKFQLRGLLLSVALLLSGATITYGFGTGAEGCGGNCAACHSISKGEAEALVKPFGADLELLDVKPSPVRGLYQATFRKGKDEGILYIDFEKKHLISGSIFDAGRKVDLTRDELAARKRIDVTRIDLDNALVMGNPAGSRKLYVFTDPECPYCARLHDELRQLVLEEPDLKVYLIIFPLAIHPNAGWKTDAIVCASKTGMGGALDLLERSFGGKELKKTACGTQYGETNGRLAADLGIDMTPTIVLPDGRVVTGMKKKDELRVLLAAPRTVAGADH